MMIIILRVLRLWVSSIAAYNINAMMIGIGEIVVSIVITKHIYKANGVEFAGVNIKRHNHCGVHNDVKQYASPNKIYLKINSLSLMLKCGTASLTFFLRPYFENVVNGTRDMVKRQPQITPASNPRKLSW